MMGGMRGGSENTRILKDNKIISLFLPCHPSETCLVLPALVDDPDDGTKEVKIGHQDQDGKHVKVEKSCSPKIGVY